MLLQQTMSGLAHLHSLNIGIHPWILNHCLVLIIIIIGCFCITTQHLHHWSNCFILFLQSTETWNPTISWSPCPMPTVGSGPWSQTLACVRSWQWAATVSVEGLACRELRAGSPPRCSVRTAKTTQWVSGRVAALSWWLEVLLVFRIQKKHKIMHFLKRCAITLFRSLIKLWKETSYSWQNGRI